MFRFHAVWSRNVLQVCSLCQGLERRSHNLSEVALHGHGREPRAAPANRFGDRCGMRMRSSRRGDRCCFQRCPRRQQRLSMQQYMSDGDATQHRRCVVTSTVINAVRGHDFLRSAGTQAVPPLQTLTLAPLAPLQTWILSVTMTWESNSSRPRFRAPNKDQGIL